MTHAEFVGVAFPAKLSQLLLEGSSKRDVFKVKDPATGKWVRGYEQLLGQPDKVCFRVYMCSLLAYICGLF